MCEQKDGKHILLTLDGEISSSVNFSKDEGIILGNIAKIIRKELFSNSTLCNGDISEERHSFSVPSRLFHLLTIMLDGKTERDISYFSPTYTV